MAGITALDRVHRVRGALDRAFGNVARVRSARRLVLHRTQAEALRSVVSRLFEPAIIEGQSFGLAIFEEQFAVIGAVEPARNDFCEPWPVKPGPVDGRKPAARHGDAL